MTAGISNMPTLHEREWLMQDVHPHKSGFTPRPIEKLATKRKPHNTVDIECSHFLRCNRKSVVHQHPTVEFQLWQEAGKHDPPFPKRPDPSYNSNVWRNFRRSYGIHATAEGRKISDVIAAMYPLNIPTPSKVGDYTFEKYIRETSLFRDEKNKALAIKQTQSDAEEFRRLKYRTEARNPPVDQAGNILPPENYKHYAHRFVPVASPPPTPPPPGQKTDMFGQRYVPKSQPHLWKLSYKLNHPEYRRLQEEITKRRKMAQEREKLKVSRVMPSPVSFEGISGME
ncbi:hypothetical protein BaRGS_00022072 [Batillaria attramentaria]|uniref:Uncharacterized protein n=1 Tax=Batillaria attramentaria TaxID=370345 RepID=A0ABD0KHK5_9CAEN